MAIYASVSDLESYVADNPEVTLSGGSEAVERLLQRAERDVDRALGPYPVLATGRKLDPTVISAPQRGALARRPVQRPSITCRSARRGTSDDDYLPTGELTVLSRAFRVSPKRSRS